MRISLYLAFLVIGGFFFVETPSIFAQGELSVELTANPNSWQAPLNDVDLTAQVTGTATGDVIYRFDCTNDGSFERVITTSSATTVAFNVCDYPNPGTYTANVQVTRGGFTASDTALISVGPAPTAPPPPPTPTISVNLTAIPSSGSAPLNDVDLKADVSGTAAGNITYRFDCTNNGPYEAEDTVSATSLTKANLCDYPSPGTYTARVFVTRQGVSAQDTVTITVNQTLVSPPPPAAALTLAVNLTANPS
ncbi:MAG: hypothetical protein Q8P03_01560, partial [bacterium]|nr:hypothetical protein [bacterium]